MAIVSTRAGNRDSGIIATAIVFHRDRPVGRYVVQDLSAGGALLTGSGAVKPGARVRVLLSFPDCDLVSLDARVQRAGVEPGGIASIEVAFRHRSDATEDLIQREALAGLLRSMRPVVLLLSDRREFRFELARDLEGLGRSVVGASTPLDAVRWLESPDLEIDTVIVTQSLRAPGAWAFLGFLAEEYPGLRRILLADETAPLDARGERPSGVYAALATVGERDGAAHPLAEILA